MPAVSAGGLGGGVIAREPEVGMLHGAGIEYFWKLKHIFLEITRNHSNNVDFALLGRAILTSVRYSHCHSNALSTGRRSHYHAGRFSLQLAILTTRAMRHHNRLFSLSRRSTLTTARYSPFSPPRVRLPLTATVLSTRSIDSHYR